VAVGIQTCPIIKNSLVQKRFNQGKFIVENDVIRSCDIASCKIKYKWDTGGIVFGGAR
jgi:hypothetical protein